jgi:integrase
LPERSRYAITAALRQALGAAVDWRYMAENPAKAAGRNPQPPPRAVRAFTTEEIAAIAAELSPMYAPLPAFAAATGLRPEEWQAPARRDVDRDERTLSVRRTVSSGEVVDLGKTAGARRQVPLAGRALDALDALPARLDTPLFFPAPGGGVLNLDNFQRREWGPAVEAAGVRKPARIYDLRSTFASNALAGVGVPTRPDHGHVGAHDRAPLRDPARRLRCGDREPPGRLGRRARASGRRGLRTERIASGVGLDSNSSLSVPRPSQGPAAVGHA